MLILRDTREQNPWLFANAEIKTLKTGDYTLSGFEDKICIERKGCVEEFSNNLVKDFSRFEKELDRMRVFDHKFIICEFPFGDVVDYPNSCKSKKAREASRISGKFLIKRISEIQLEYDVNVMFFDDRKSAMQYVDSLLRRVYERYTQPE